MKVSIIIPAYNIENYIERCINSAINQTLKEIEIIVIDDGSTDKTLDVIKKIAEADKRIIVKSQDNRGSIEARKLGFNIARGKYILFVDGDDWIELNTAELLYNESEKYELDILMYNSFWCYEDKKIYKNIFNENINVCEEPLKHLLLGNIPAGIVFKFIKKDFILRNDISFPNDISYAEDLATSALWFIYTPKIKILNAHLYNYYQRNDSITHVVNSKMKESEISILFIEENMIQHKIYNKYLSEFNMMIFNYLMMHNFIKIDRKSDLHKLIYKQYKKRNIDIYGNKYIKEELEKYPKSLRLRVLLYDKNYKLGMMYDKLHEIVKMIIK